MCKDVASDVPLGICFQARSFDALLHELSGTRREPGIHGQFLDQRGFNRGSLNCIGREPMFMDLTQARLRTRRPR